LSRLDVGEGGASREVKGLKPGARKNSTAPREDRTHEIVVQNEAQPSLGWETAASRGGRQD